MTAPLRLSKSAAWLKILSFVVAISGSAWLFYGIYFFFWSARADDARYKILAIVQTGPEKEALKTSFLAELLSLAIDRPVNLYQFDLRGGQEKLLRFPLIKEATLKRIPPGTLYIDYAIRRPVAYLRDLENTAIDEEGYLIPFKPFFSPKKLPSIEVGIKNEKLKWGEKLSHPNGELALEIAKSIEELLAKTGLDLTSIDASKAHTASLGDEKVVVTLEEGMSSRSPGAAPLHYTLILNVEKVRENLSRFKRLLHSKNELLSRSKVLDLRLDQLAFIAEEER